MENTIIVGQRAKGRATALVLAIICMVIGIYFLASFLVLAFDPDFLWLFVVASSFIGIAVYEFVVFATFNHIGITVTDKCVNASGRIRVRNIPLNEIYSAVTSGKNGIVINTKRGHVKIQCIKNNSEVCDAVNRLLTDIKTAQRSVPVQAIPPQELQRSVSVQAIPPHEPQRSVADCAEQLKMFKELLDSGVITQEDFDAKKKQLLGL